MNSLYSATAHTATSTFNAIYGKDLDADISLRIIENFCNAYKEKARRSYTGAIDQGDIAKALNGCTINLGRFTEPDAYKAFFERKDKAAAERVTFADVINHLVSKSIGERFGV